MADLSKTSIADTLAAVEALPGPQKERFKRVLRANQERGAAPSMDLKLKDGVLEIVLKGDPVLVQALQMADIGTADPDFLQGLVGQIACVGSQGKGIDSGNSNFVMAVVRSIEPRDELEAMLAAQMGAIHAATMMMVRRLNCVETIPQQDAAERALNKLARTFAGHMETLKRYRTGGQQKVTVEHVTVNAGGQAIVGTVETGGKI